jgi:hypothetical protein
VIHISWDIHPWMRSDVFVSKTNFSALTDEHDAFSIPGLPPDEKESKIWLESLGTTKAKFTIDAAGNSKVLQVLMAPKKSP